MTRQQKVARGESSGPLSAEETAREDRGDRDGEISDVPDVDFERRVNVGDRRAAGGDRRMHLVDRRGVFADRRRATEARYRAPLDSQSQAQLSAWQDAERRRIAADLHDSIGSSLCTIRLKLQDTIEKLPQKGDGGMPSVPLLEVVADISRAMEEVRRIAMDLRPAILDDLGIVATISWLARQHEASGTGIRMDKQVEVREQSIPDPQKTAIYRIVQESLNNVVKHSGAQTVRITLREVDQQLQLEVVDDGHGFAMPQVLERLDPGVHYGVANMRQRATSSGGELVIKSRPGSGTVVRCTWPRRER
jgi:signal transduction histidine kinase